MIQTTEHLTHLPAPETRALHVAEFVTTVAARGQLPHDFALPIDPAYTFVIDDPTGHFPLEVTNTTQLGFEVGQQGIARIYAISGYHDPRHEEVARLRAEQRGREARALARTIPGLRHFTFRSADLTDNWRIILPTTYYPNLEQMR